ncbi:hypothetical protein Tco_1149092, partial [Tanacetum coccineum]
MSTNRRQSKRKLKVLVKFGDHIVRPVSRKSNGTEKDACADGVLGDVINGIFGTEISEDTNNQEAGTKCNVSNPGNSTIIVDVIDNSINVELNEINMVKMNNEKPGWKCYANM